MQIDLPIHEPSRHEEFLDGIDPLLFDYQPVVFDSKHFDDAFTPNFAFCHPGVKTIPREVIHAIHVQLRGDQLMEKTLGVVVVEDGNGRVQRTVHFII